MATTPNQTIVNDTLAECDTQTVQFLHDQLDRMIDEAIEARQDTLQLLVNYRVLARELVLRLAPTSV